MKKMLRLDHRRPLMSTFYYTPFAFNRYLHKTIKNDLTYGEDDVRHNNHTRIITLEIETISFSFLT